jgi:hypothetical protein
MKLQETIRRILMEETKEHKVKSFMYSKFDKVFDGLNLDVEYGDKNYVYGKWYNQEDKVVFHRNDWGVLWVSECGPYRKLRAYSKSISLNLDEFNNLLIEYLNDKYSEKFKGKSFKNVGDEYHCLKNDYLGESEETSEMKEGELTEKCWAGYTQKGMKTMFGKRYPNCVKKTK